MSRIEDIKKRKSERKTKLLAALHVIVEQLKDIGAVKIILFGSLNRGDVDVNSDLDLFVLMPSSKTGKEWMNLIYERVERKVASNIIVFSQEEFEERSTTSSFLRSLLNGSVIYEKAA